MKLHPFPRRHGFALLFMAIMSTTAMADLYDAPISQAAYPVLNQRTMANRSAFYVYQNQDAGVNKGFPSGFYGVTTKIHINAGCIDDPNATGGCSADTGRLDRAHGTVLSITFDPLTAGQFAGINIEEPENYGANPRGIGYDLRGATQVVFDVRAPEPGGATVRFGVGRHVSDFIHLSQSTTYTTMTLSLAALGLSQSELADEHLLFAVATNDVNAPNGATVLLDNIRFEPVPTSQQSALGFPVGNQTFGTIPLSTSASGRIPFPPDQLLRNLTTIYESSLTLMGLVHRGTPSDLVSAHLIADTFDYALHHPNHGDPLPTAPDGSVGLQNGFSNGDIALHNDQGTGQGQAGDVRLAGFTCGLSPTGFCLVLDGATGGNNAFAILALLAAYRQFQDPRYLDDARTIGHWIVGNLTDTSQTGYGGYFLGYDDRGVPPPKPLNKGKSVENNADIFAAFTALAEIENALGHTAEAAAWTRQAAIAGDFVMAMFAASSGRFYAGTAPPGTPTSPGIDPSGQQRGNDIINVADFLDSDTFTTLSLAASRRYHNQIDWQRPVQYVLDTFAQSVQAGGQTFDGFDLVANPTAGPNGIAWEFTGQAVETMRFIDRLYATTRFEAAADFYQAQLQKAQNSAPFTDGQGLVASTLQNGDTLPPGDQALSTPFQDIAERVGLAATTWAIFGEQTTNVFLRLNSRFDINGDGQSDLVFQNQTTRQIAFWFMNGSTVSGSALASLTPQSGWSLAGVGDFSGDGQSDLVFQNQTTGQVAVWFMHGATFKAGAFVSLTPAAGWKAAGVGDFNGDGKPDLVFQNQTTGQVAIWYLNGTTFVSGAYTSLTPQAGWKVVGVGDFNGDGHPDLVLQNSSTNQVAIWYLNGTTFVSGAYTSLTPQTGWKVAGIADLNGDGQPDLVFQNQTTNQVAIWYLNGTTFVSGAYTSLTPQAGWKVGGPR